MTLHEVPVGSQCQITGYVRGYPRAHLLSMGLTPGVHFQVVDRAPLGDPVVLRVRDIRLSVRAQDALALQFECF